MWVSHMGIGFLHDLNFPEVKRERKGRLLFTCPGVGPKAKVDRWDLRAVRSQTSQMKLDFII